MVPDFTIAKNLREEAIEFEMNNLKAFPFSRLRNGLQLEIIEGLNVPDKMELFKVNSQFQGYFARNGPFGQHVDLIQAIAGPESHLDVRRAAGHGRFLLPDLNRNRKKVLFRKIRSCAQFLMKPSYGYRDEVLEDVGKETTNYFADCFGNLCVVSELRASRLFIPLRRKILAALQFEVTDWAELNLKHSDRTRFFEVAYFLKSYLEKQLKNCKKVAIIVDFKLDLEQADKVLKEIPGFQLEEDSNKVEEMLEALYKNGTDKTSIVSAHSEVKCYQRKIGKGEQGFVLVVFTKDYFPPDDYKISARASRLRRIYDDSMESRDD